MDINTILATLILTALGSAGTALMGVGIAWARKHLSATNLALLQQIVAAAVQATEQVAAANGPPAFVSKLDAAMIRAKQLAASAGVTITDQQLRTLIEQAVLALKRADGQLIVGTVETIPPPEQATP